MIQPSLSSFHWEFINFQLYNTYRSCSLRLYKITLFEADHTKCTFSGSRRDGVAEIQMAASSQLRFPPLLSVKIRIFINSQFFNRQYFQKYSQFISASALGIYPAYIAILSYSTFLITESVFSKLQYVW